MTTFHTFLVILLIISGFCVFLSDNPVHSVLFLILTFCEAASILFLFHAEFLGLLFIIIYVGAIAVLFLFVVMMLNVKVYSSKVLLYIPLLVLSATLMFAQFSTFFTKVFFNIDFQSLDMGTIALFDGLSNIDLFGQVFYNNFLICFLLAGLVLLIAMIGAIVLTVNFKSHRKNELVIRQLAGSEKNILHFR